MRGQPELYTILEKLKISFEYHEHDAAPTMEEAMKYWKHIDSAHCKNIFFRNHKGNQHYLVILEGHKAIAVRDLEQKLKQGKLSFASEKRLMQYLGVKPGSVSPFGLINDNEKHVHVFLDEALQTVDKISFHPNDNTASIVIFFSDLVKFLNWTGNSYEFLNLS